MITYNSNIDTDLLRFKDSNGLSNLDDKIPINTLGGLFSLRGVPSSIALASAITAYAQIEMMKYKNMPDNIMYYSDTDSLLMEKPLPPEVIDKDKLGYFKLEHIIKEGYFIAPKFYAYTTIEGETLIKTRGLDSNSICYEDFEKLSNGHNVTLTTNISYKDLENGTVHFKDVEYTIQGVINSDTDSVTLEEPLDNKH